MKCNCCTSKCTVDTIGNLNGKNVVITGGNGGIGYRIERCREHEDGETRFE